MKTWIVMVGILLLVLLISGCTYNIFEPSGETDIPKQTTKPEISIFALEQEIHNLINDERGKVGLSVLEWSNKLSDIARKHSQDMANRDYFDHYDLEGNDFSYRYEQNGFSCGITVGGFIYMGAENIFQNYLYDSITYYDTKTYYNWSSQSEITESTVSGWMDSPGHRENIMTKYWENEGIGIAITNEYEVYITQNFC